MDTNVKVINKNEGELLGVAGGNYRIFKELGEPVQPGQMLPVPELTEKLKEFLKALDLKYNQKTYPPNFIG